MTNPVVGINCDLTLQHAEVNGGSPLALILFRKESEPYGPALQVHYESYTDALGQAGDVRHLWFTVILAEGLLGPDGSAFGEDIPALRAHLVDALMKHSDISLTSPSGIITGLGTSGLVMIHKIMPLVELIEVHLTTRSVFFAPINPLYFNQSAWVDELSYTGEMNWDNTYWR